MLQTDGGPPRFRYRARWRLGVSSDGTRGGAQRVETGDHDSDDEEPAIQPGELAPQRPLTGSLTSGSAVPHAATREADWGGKEVLEGWPWECFFSSARENGAVREYQECGECFW